MNQKQCPKCKLDLKVLPSSGRYVCQCGWTSKKQDYGNDLNNIDFSGKQETYIDEEIIKDAITTYLETVEEINKDAESRYVEVG